MHPAVSGSGRARAARAGPADRSRGWQESGTPGKRACVLRAQAERSLLDERDVSMERSAFQAAIPRYSVMEANREPKGEQREGVRMHQHPRRIGSDALMLRGTRMPLVGGVS